MCDIKVFGLMHSHHKTQLYHLPCHHSLGKRRWSWCGCGREQTGTYVFRVWRWENVSSFGYSNSTRDKKRMIRKSIIHSMPYLLPCACLHPQDVEVIGTVYKVRHSDQHLWEQEKFVIRMHVRDLQSYIPFPCPNESDQKLSRGSPPNYW